MAEEINPIASTKPGQTALIHGEDVDYVHALGADTVSVDVVLDTVGGETQLRSFRTMKPGGALVATTAPRLRQVAALMDASKFRVRVGLIPPLSEARQAQEKNQAGQVRGKVVLSVAD